MKKSILLALCLLFISAVFVRLIYFKDFVTFFYDQARDAIMSMEIFRGDPVKILGPSSDFAGLFHGPLYWYILSPFYHFTNGNVYVVRFVLILINATGVFFIYRLTHDLFQKTRVSTIASIIFAFSFEASQYGRWLSNPSPVVITSLVSFWALWKLLKGYPRALPLLLFSWGLSVQFQLFMLYQSVVFVIIWIALKGFKPPVLKKRDLALSVVCLLTTFSTYIVSELKFNFQATHSLVKFFSEQSPTPGTFLNTFLNIYSRITDSFFLNVWGINPEISKALSVLTIVFVIFQIAKKKYKDELVFLGIWLISPSIAIFLKGPDTTYITVGILTPVIIISSLVIGAFIRRKFITVFLLLIIISGNMFLAINRNKEGEALFDIQHKSLLGDQVKLIEWIYKEAEGKPFTINTITEPLFINTRWAFLFDWQANTKYGYMPIWWGETQVDVPGHRIKFSDWTDPKLHFLIIEPSSRSDDNFTKAIKLLENQRSEVISKESFGVFVVEKRNIKKRQTFTGMDAYNLLKEADLNELKKVN